MKQVSPVLLGIAVRPAPGGMPQEMNNVVIDEHSGVDGDYRRTPGSRQVTVLARSGWEAACGAVGADLPWTTRRANLYIDGVDLIETRGSRLRIGDVVLEITGETRPCEVMEAAYAGLRRALGSDWRAGVTCKVLTGGLIQVGDPVTLEQQEVPA